MLRLFDDGRASCVVFLKKQVRNRKNMKIASKRWGLPFSFKKWISFNKWNGLSHFIYFSFKFHFFLVVAIQIKWILNEKKMKWNPKPKSRPPYCSDKTNKQTRNVIVSSFVLRAVALLCVVKWQQICRSLTNCPVFLNSFHTSPAVGDVGRSTGKRARVVV